MKSNHSSTNETRLNKYLAQAGVCSRRKADELIESGQVQVNGKTVYELGVRVTAQDRITVNHKPIKTKSEKVYIAFHKPENVLTTMQDPEERPCITDYLPRTLHHRVFPVGRLDWDSEGLLLLTNDGDFAQEISHPARGVPKTYWVKLDGQPSDQHLQRLKIGVSIPGGRAKALAVRKIKRGKSEKYDWIQIIIDEGRNRQVRKMFEKIGYDVKKLRRVAIGNFKLGQLKKGEMLPLSAVDLARVLSKPAELKPRPSLKPLKPKIKAKPTTR